MTSQESSTFSKSNTSSILNNTSNSITCSNYSYTSSTIIFNTRYSTMKLINRTSTSYFTSFVLRVRNNSSSIRNYSSVYSTSTPRRRCVCSVSTNTTLYSKMSCFLTISTNYFKYIRVSALCSKNYITNLKRTASFTISNK